MRRSARAGGGRKGQDEDALPSPSPSLALVLDLSRARGTAAACSDGGSAAAVGDADDARKTRRRMRRRRLKSERSDELLAPLCPVPKPGHEKRTHSCAPLLRCRRCCDCGASAAAGAEMWSFGGAGRGSSDLRIVTQKEGR